MRRKKPVILKRSDHRLDLGPVGYNLFVSRDKQQEERSARRLRAWMRAVIGLVIAGGAVVAGLFIWSYLVPYFHQELQIGAASGLESEPASSEVSALPVYDEMGLPVYDNEVNLFVINPEEPAQEDFAPQLGTAAGVQVDSRIVAAVELMAAAAKEDGLALTFTEGYVSYQEQGERFEEKVDQLMEGHIVPQGLRAAGQGGVQGDVALPPVAVAPLALHTAQPQLRTGHPKGLHQRIDPVQRLPQQPQALPPGGLRRQLRPRGPLPLQRLDDPPAFGPDHGVRLLCRAAQRD